MTRVNFISFRAFIHRSTPYFRPRTVQRMGSTSKLKLFTDHIDIVKLFVVRNSPLLTEHTDAGPEFDDDVPF